MKAKRTTRHRNRIPVHNEKLHTLARSLRKQSTLGEVLLWRQLRGRQLGVQFHRQVPILEYIVDFYCHELELAVEVDGASHAVADVGVRDERRQREIEDYGITVLRFDDRDVRRDPVHVANSIKLWIDNCRDGVAEGPEENHPPSRG